MTILEVVEISATSVRGTPTAPSSEYLSTSMHSGALLPPQTMTILELVELSAASVRGTPTLIPSETTPTPSQSYWNKFVFPMAEEVPDELEESAATLTTDVPASSCRGPPSETKVRDTEFQAIQSRRSHPLNPTGMSPEHLAIPLPSKLKSEAATETPAISRSGPLLPKLKSTCRGALLPPPNQCQYSK